MKSILVALFTLLMNASGIADDGVKTVERTLSIPPVSMTYDDAAFILNHIHKLIETANAGYKDQQGRIKEDVRTSISAGEDAVSLTGWRQLTDVQGLPKVAKSLRFNYSYYQAPIASVELILSDTFRQISIQGTDEAQVQAIASFLRESVQKHQNYFGGLDFRSFGAIILLMIGAVLVSLRNTKTGKPMWTLALAGVLIFAALFFAPWDSWLPGVAIYSGTANFIDRNINLISFIAVILTFVGAVLKEISKLRGQDGQS